ncbi:MAG: hypothetical protein LBL13_11945 [Bacteroidales bacterium]|jgi:hypothetical protein|nr:hypothetical protein [Bacteroidales bacterium]
MRKILTDGKIQHKLMLEFGVSRPTINTALKFKRYVRQCGAIERDRKIRERALGLGGMDVELEVQKPHVSQKSQIGESLI